MEKLTESVKNLTFINYLFLALFLIGLQVLVLLYQGHIWICECGYVDLWYGLLNSPGDSQHISDWYTFSHVIHGFAFYFLLRKIFKDKFPIPMYFIFAIAIEVGWEILENSPIIINRYRETASLMYYGDSILNSFSDVIAMSLGFLMAYKLSTWLSITIVVFFELFVLYFIHDNLTLNIIMLIHPFETIKNWQLGI